MPDPVVNSHWIVAAFTPSEDNTDEDNPIGVVGTTQDNVYATLALAQAAAREAAAATPGTYYVVYSAEWWATTDITPVSLYKVGTFEQVA
jgi:hypothetical protein